MKKPIIGLSTGMMLDSDRQFEGSEQIYTNRDYTDAVTLSGGIPILLPIDKDTDNIKRQVELLDGLIITGGNDIFPYNYNQEPHVLLKDTLPERDTFELKLIKYAKEKEIPILGICRGHQLINVYEGGTLYQDLSLVENSTLRHWQKESRYVKTQRVNIKTDSILSKIYDNEIMINTFHHQAVDKVATCFEVIARTSDGIIEAIEHRDYPFLLGVQWHPEMLHSKCKDAQNLFTLFVNTCNTNRK